MKAYLTPDEIEKLEQQPDNHRDRLFIRTVCRLGCRVSEALSIQVKDIDWENKTIRIVHLKSRVHLTCPECSARLGRNHSFCPKCGVAVKEAISRELAHRRMRTLPVDSRTLEMLKQYVEQGGPVEKDGKNLIFGIGRGQAWRIVKTNAEKAELGKLVNPETGKQHNVSPHKLRDSFAVRAIKHDDSGDGLRLLQEHLGHTSFNTTAKYRKIGSDESRDWYDKLWGENDPDEA